MFRRSGGPGGEFHSILREGCAATALTAEQRRKKREKKQARDARRAEEPVPRPRVARPELGDFVECRLGGNGEGPASMVVLRALAFGGVRMGVFLLDPDCFGVKDSFWTDLSLSRAREAVAKVCPAESSPELTPEQARRVLEQAVDFARGLGFEPGGDFVRSASLLADVEASEEVGPLRFPQREKPIYFARPDESSHRVREVVQTLLASVGPEGFHYVMSPWQARAVQDLLDDPGPTPGVPVSARG